ncbi:MAG: FAD-dependent oxidoreductase, partial [Armatimonadota bacterium]|nr:FAD-dependent oxidoreductase [Armatimonadota bacterium]
MESGRRPEERSTARKVVQEAPRATPVRDEVDVLVAGGGLGGVSAAVAAARAGARTLLVERNGFVGGVATAGMCCSVHNCFYTPSHELVVRGNALEFVDALARAEGPRSAWHHHKGHIIYDVERGKLVLLELLENAGVAFLCDALVVGVVMEGRVLRGVVVESKSGREAILSKVVVDATGDADVAALAGAPVRVTGAEWRAPHSYCFRVGNVDVDRFVGYFAAHPDH